MLNLIQHLTKSRTYETLKQVQGDKLGLFTRPSNMNLNNEEKWTLLDLEKSYGQTSIIYGMLAIQSIPYLISYSLIFEGRVL